MAVDNKKITALAVLTAVLFVIGVLSATRSAFKDLRGEFNKQVLAMEQTTQQRDAELGEVIAELKALKVERDDCLEREAKPAEVNQKQMKKFITSRFYNVPEEVAEVIAAKTSEASKEYGVDFDLIVGLMYVESGFNPFAESKVGARGLLQVMHCVWGETYNIKNASDLHDIDLNIRTGVHILKHYIEKNKGNITHALQNYNGAKKDGREFSNGVYQAIGKFVSFKNQRTYTSSQ